MKKILEHYLWYLLSSSRPTKHYNYSVSVDRAIAGENMCIDKHSRHDGRDTADNGQQSGQFPQICCTQWKKKAIKMICKVKVLKGKKYLITHIQ